MTDHSSDKPRIAGATGEPEAEQVWQDSTGQLLARLKTQATGLTSAEVRSRLATYGPNDAAIVKRSPLWLQFLARFSNPLIIILLIAFEVVFSLIREFA